MQVLKLDRTCEEAAKELTRVRTQQLIDMGFSPKHAEQAVLSKNSLQQALDYLLTGVGMCPISLAYVLVHCIHYTPLPPPNNLNRKYFI